MSMTTVVVEYLNERAATAEKLAIEAYEIMKDLANSAPWISTEALEWLERNKSLDQNQEAVE